MKESHGVPTCPKAILNSLFVFHSSSESPREFFPQMISFTPISLSKSFKVFVFDGTPDLLRDVNAHPPYVKKWSVI
jgi:hypothetical protein